MRKVILLKLSLTNDIINGHISSGINFFSGVVSLMKIIYCALFLAIGNILYSRKTFKALLCILNKFIYCTDLKKI